MSQSITPAPITNIYPWQVTSEYHHPCPRASPQHPSPTSTPGRSPVSITTHVPEHHPSTITNIYPWQVTSEYHHPCLRASPMHPLVYPGRSPVSPPMSQSITPTPITTIYPWQVTSEYHHPCLRASPQHPSPTSTPGRLPVSITIHVPEHQPCTHHQHLLPLAGHQFHYPCLRASTCTHHQHLPLAGYQWVSPSMSESITHAPITNIYPLQVTSEYHHPCPRASPQHPSPTSTPGRLPVSITIWEHHPCTHQSTPGRSPVSWQSLFLRRVWLLNLVVNFKLRCPLFCLLFSSTYTPRRVGYWGGTVLDYASFPCNVSWSWQSWIWLLSDKQHLLAVGDSMGTLHILEIPWSLRLPTTNEVCMYSNILVSQILVIWQYHLFLVNTWVNSRYQSTTSVVVLVKFHHIQFSPEAMEYTGDEHSSPVCLLGSRVCKSTLSQRWRDRKGEAASRTIHTERKWKRKRTFSLTFVIFSLWSFDLFSLFFDALRICFLFRSVWIGPCNRCSTRTLSAIIIPCRIQNCCEKINC